MRFPPDDCFSLNDPVASNDPEDNTISDNLPPFKIETNINKTSNLNYNEDLLVINLEIPVSNPIESGDVIIVESEKTNSTSLVVNPITNSTRKYFVIYIFFK